MINVIVMSIVAAVTNADRIVAGDHTRSVQVDGRTRSYLVHVPKRYDGTTPFPVVLCFHGGGGNADQMQRYCGLNAKADRAGFIVVYPRGTGRIERIATWNGGNCCGYAMRNKVDDVTFVRWLLDDLGRVAKIDSKRVYATGISNGGIISYRLADELSGRIAAIAPVGGPMGTATCNPKRAVSVIHFHGTDDEFAPFAGGRTKKGISPTNFYSVDHSIRAWVKANACQSKPTVEKLPDKADDGMTVTRTTYGAGRDGSEVVLITIHGGGHTWPGQKPRLKLLGASTQDISANDLMWEFFKRHPLK